MTNTNPKRGIYDGVDFEEYLGWDAISQSSLKRMAKSPRHYSRQPDSKESKALKIGSLVHCAALEASALHERYVVMPRYELEDENVTAAGQPTTSRATKYYKKRAEEFKRENAGREIVSQEEYSKTQAIVYALQENELARRLLREEGRTEVSLIWDDPETGLPLKARIDKQWDGGILDLKTTRSLGDFPKQAATLHYHVQAAHYLAGWRAVGDSDIRDAWILAVESEAPHCAHAAPLDAEALQRGEQLRRRWLRRVVECSALRSWPGPELPEVWRLPEWALMDEEPMVIQFGNETMEV